MGPMWVGRHARVSAGRQVRWAVSGRRPRAPRPALTTWRPAPMSAAIYSATLQRASVISASLTACSRPSVAAMASVHRPSASVRRAAPLTARSHSVRRPGETPRCRRRVTPSFSAWSPHLAPSNLRRLRRGAWSRRLVSWTSRHSPSASGTNASVSGRQLHRGQRVLRMALRENRRLPHGHGILTALGQLDGCKLRDCLPGTRGLPTDGGPVFLADVFINLDRDAFAVETVRPVLPASGSSDRRCCCEPGRFQRFRRRTS